MSYMDYSDELEQAQIQQDQAMKGQVIVPIPAHPIYGTCIDELLNTETVRTGRQQELGIIARRVMDIPTNITEAVIGAHIEDGRVEDDKGDIARSHFVAKQMAYYQPECTMQSTTD